ncbi:MAG: response regulator, partial [Chloroflexota bacterium]
SRFWLDVEKTVTSSEAIMRNKTPYKQIISYKGPRKKILLVDDDIPSRTFFTKLLEPIDFELVEASDGPTAIEKAQVIQPDLILIDLVMPEMTGFKATREIRRLQALKNVVIIATSARIIDMEEAESTLAGFDAFLPKPIQIGTLFTLIEKHLELKWIYREPAEDETDFSVAITERNQKEIIPPPQEEMAVLFDLAMMGDMIGLESQALKIKEMDDQFIPFANKLHRLAKQFEDEQVLALVKHYMEKTQ